MEIKNKNGDVISTNMLDDNQAIFVNMSEFIQHNIIVQTTNKNIKDCMERLRSGTGEYVKYLFCKLSASLRKADYEKAYKDKKMWSDICSDIVILACARYLLFGSKIPMSLNLEHLKGSIKPEEEEQHTNA
jgi:hypothetical protein